jgi:hypothetical protein
MDLEVVGIGIVVQNNQIHVDSLVLVGVCPTGLSYFTLLCKDLHSVNTEVQFDSLFLSPLNNRGQNPKILWVDQITTVGTVVSVERELDIFVNRRNGKFSSYVCTDFHVVSLVGVGRDIITPTNLRYTLVPGLSWVLVETPHPIRPKERTLSRRAVLFVAEYELFRQIIQTTSYVDPGTFRKLENIRVVLRVDFIVSQSFVTVNGKTH